VDSDRNDGHVSVGWWMGKSVGKYSMNANYCSKQNEL
jgi:hypothetical protein